jgi:hypothetical protein
LPLAPYSELKISVAQATVFLNKVAAHQPIVFEVGFGGVLVAYLGKLRPWKFQPKRLRGDAKLFVYEYWELWKDGQKIADRWQDEESHTVEKFGQKILHKITFSRQAQRTILELSDGYQVQIFREEEYTSWYFSSDQEKWEVQLRGWGDFLLRNFTPEKERKMPKWPIKKIEGVAQFYRENLPLSFELVQKIVKAVEGKTLQKVEDRGGVECSFQLSGEWVLSIQSNWKLFDPVGKVVLDSKTNRFFFADKMSKLLKGKKVVRFVISPQLHKTRLYFSDGFFLKVKKEDRYCVWSLFQREEDFWISAIRPGVFRHLISCPDGLIPKYSLGKKDGRVAAVLYSLELYRKWLAL